MSATKAGSITLFTGPMYSGKSSAILSEIRSAAFAGLPGVIICRRGCERYATKDDGDGAVLTTHGGVRLGSSVASESAAAVRVTAADFLKEVQLAPHETTVAVDEGQFFPDLREMCVQWVLEGKNVYVAALNSTYEQHEFPAVSALIAVCDRIKKFCAVCMDCRQPGASFTRRLKVGSGELFIPGTKDQYHAVCRPCWRQPQ